MEAELEQAVCLMKVCLVFECFSSAYGGVILVCGDVRSGARRWQLTPPMSDH